ncbi:glycoside hydrolase family 38 C-terminal domain-containing protein, partial [Sedimentibacter sp. B4]|uniref:glycoside hydrolase family 38 C-terminal domain-containing protein n=1 Tax=Sedimentibacter sp. B4 TaxID=304766 RepID=UPI0026F3E2D2
EEIITDALTALTGTGETLLIANAAPHDRDGVPALGVDASSTTPQAAVEEHPDGTFTLANEHLRAVVDATGELVSLVDTTTGREAIAPDRPGNRLELFRDIPNQWDAWDIDEFYRRAGVPTEPGTATLDERDGEPVITIRKQVG